MTASVFTGVFLRTQRSTSPAYMSSWGGRMAVFTNILIERFRSGIGLEYRLWIWQSDTRRIGRVVTHPSLPGSKGSRAGEKREGTSGFT